MALAAGTGVTDGVCLWPEKHRLMTKWLPKNTSPEEGGCLSPPPTTRGTGSGMSVSTTHHTWNRLKDATESQSAKFRPWGAHQDEKSTFFNKSSVREGKGGDLDEKKWGDLVTTTVRAL